MDYELEESLRSESEERLRMDAVYQHPSSQNVGGIYVQRDIKVTREPRGSDGVRIGGEAGAQGLRRSEAEVFAGPHEYGVATRPWGR